MVRQSYGLQTGQPNIRQEEFAEIIRVGRQALAAWEIGRNQPHDIDAVVLKIHMITGVDPEWLLGRPLDLGPTPGGGGRIKQEQLSACTNVVHFPHTPLGVCLNEAA